MDDTTIKILSAIIVLLVVYILYKEAQDNPPTPVVQAAEPPKPAKVKDTGPVDTQMQLALLRKKVEKRYGLADDLYTIARIAGDRHVTYWTDEATGRIMWQFTDVLAWQETQEQIENFNADYVDTPPLTLPEEKEFVYD